jgi:hypothetical protein
MIEMRLPGAAASQRAERSSMSDDIDGVNAQATKEFRIKEFEALKREIDGRREDQWKIERDVLLATIAIVWALTTIGATEATKNVTKVMSILWLSPLCIWFAGVCRWIDNDVLVRDLGAFIGKREPLLDPVHLGWEDYSLSSSSQRKRKFTFGLRVASWVFILLIDIGFAVYGFYLPHR